MKPKKIPKIGLKADPTYFDWHTDLGYDVLELASKDPDLGFKIMKIINAKKTLEGKELSMHSQLSRIFSCKEKGFPEFNEAEINVLKAEIILCRILGAKELIFHMKVEPLNEDEEKILGKMFKFAKKNGVEMIFESNNKFAGLNTLDVLSRFPELKYNLDLGHFNVGIGTEDIGMSVDDFLLKIKDRVAYIHAHNNNGIKDEHRSLDEGTLDWKHILDMLDLSKIRKIIMEVRTPEAASKTKKLLEDYLKAKKIGI